MTITTKLRGLGALLLVWLAGTGLAFAQANSIEGFDVAQQGSNVVIRITTKDALKSAPPSFTVANPARIVFDFPNTTNGLGRNSQDISQGELRSMNLVQGSDRTRMVFNLRRTVSHEVSVDGKNIIVTLSAAAAAPTGGAANQVSHFAEGKADAKHAVREVDFRRGNAGEGRVMVDMTDSSTGIDIRQQGQNIVIEFLKTSLPENLRRRLDVVDFATPVQTISTFQQGENVRMVIEAKGQWEHNAYQSDTQFVVEVKPAAVDPSKLSQRGRYSGEKLSLNFQNVEVRAVLNVIADFTDLNIITSDTVAGSITLRLKDVPWDQALDIILQTRGLDMRKSGNVIWIAPRDELATREKLQLEAQSQINELEQTRTEAFQMNYQKAADVQKLLSDATQRMLSKRGSAVVDARTNTLFVQDVPSRLEEVRKLIARIDVPVRQVMIEARIVEANVDYNKALGVRWGGASRRGNWSVYGKDGATSFDDDGRVLLPGTDTFGNYTLEDGTAYVPFVDMGVANSTSGIGIGFLTDNITLDLQLSAMEATGNGEIISQPKVVTSDKETAKILKGQEVPYQEASSSGATTTAFKEAALSLEVTPQITPDNRIIMEVKVTKDAPNFQAALNGVPPINKNEVNAKVLVNDGETIVIGGVFENTQTKATEKVPFLGDLPFVGRMFRRDIVQDEKTELLVFITPRIMNNNSIAVNR